MAEDVKCKIKLKKRIRENTLQGRVQIISESQLLIQHAYIEITGCANCSFNLGKIRIKSYKIYSKGTVVKGFQQFYYTRHTLCGGEIPHHHEGSQSYSFKCYWPSRLPGTWFGYHGCIEYMGKVTIKLQNNKDIYVHSQMINVKFKRNLTTETHLLFEAREEVRRSFFTTKPFGTVTVTVWLPICGISAGQSLPVLCRIINHSKLHFGTLIFVLTRIDIFRSDTPVCAVKKIRTDVCRVTRPVNIHRGKYDYYSVLKTDADTIPTNQFFTCNCCQVIYELWVSVQGAFQRYRIFGYPNIDTPGIPVIIGTKPLRKFDTNEITTEIFKKMYEYNVPIFFDELPEDVKQIIQTDEELNTQAVENLQRQLDQDKILHLMKQGTNKSIEE